MTGRTEVELILDRYLAEGSERVADRVIDAALDEIDSTTQRRTLRLPWFHVPPLLRVGLAAGAVLVLLVSGMVLIGRPTPQVGANPGPTPTPSATAPASTSVRPGALPPLASTFTSESYGYSFRYPDGWSATHASARWWPPDWKSGGSPQEPFDSVASPGDRPIFRAASALLPEDAVVDAWIAENITFSDVPGCAPPRDTLEAVVIDGQPGRLRDSCGEVEATVVAGRRVYVFTLFVGPSGVGGARALFDAIAATMELAP